MAERSGAAADAADTRAPQPEAEPGAATEDGAKPGLAVTSPAPDDPLSWWEDKQVAVSVRGNAVRGWVLRSRSRPVCRVDELGTMTIVLLIVNQTLAGHYPGEVTVTVRAGGPHGRPDHVLGLWDEGDTYDVRRHHTSRRAS